MHVSVQTSSVVPCSMDLGLFTCGTGTPTGKELDSTTKQVEHIDCATQCRVYAFQLLPYLSAILIARVP